MRCALRWPGCGLRRQVPCRRRLHNPQPQGGRTTKRLLRLPGRGPRRQAPCRRRLQNPQRPQGVASLTFSYGHAAKRGVAKAPSAQASRRTERVRRRAGGGVSCAHASPLRLKKGNQQREKRDQQRSLCSACAPTSPVLPVCKSYQQRKKISTRLLVLGVHPPPAGASPHITRMQKLSAAQKAARRVPPPPSGAGPAITRMQKLSAAQKAARRVPPPIRGRPRYYPYAKVISSAQSDLRSQMVQALG